MNDTTQGANARFLPEVEEALRSMGWYPKRQAEEEILQKWYVLRWKDTPGYCRIFPAAYRFLHEFGGLTLNDGGDTCLINPLEAVGNYEDFWIYYEWRIETRLYPLGQWMTGNVLHVDIQGRFWDLPDPFLWGNSIEEALTRILSPERIWPDKGEVTPLDQATEELIERITNAERKLFPE